MSISCLYPNALEPELGVFIQRRLQSLATSADIMVIAPSAVFIYGNPAGQRIRLGRYHSSAVEPGATLSVRRPRWFYPPLAGVLNALFLFVRLLVPVARLRKDFSFQLLDAHFAHPDGIAAALLSILLRCPFTVTLRGSEMVHSRPRFRRVLIGWSLRRASRVFALSETLRRLAMELGVPPARVKIVSNGVDTSLFYPRDRMECRKKHDVPLDHRILLSAGHLIEGKGHQWIVRALKTLRAEGMKARLFIAGGAGREKRHERELRQLIAELGLGDAVFLLGHVTPEQLAELMSAADVFCLASHREGSSNVVREALACGTPVVATKVGDLPQLVSDARYGILVPVGDQRSLEEALRWALQKQWDKEAIVARGRERTWDDVAREVFAEMEEILLEQEITTVQRSGRAVS